MGIGTLALSFPDPEDLPYGIQLEATDDLLQRATANSNDTGAWSELEVRIHKEDFSPEQSQRLIEGLELQTRSLPADDQIGCLYYLDSLISLTRTKGWLDDATFLRLCDLHYGDSVEVTVAATSSDTGFFEFGVDYGFDWEQPVPRIWSVTHVSLDGKPVPFREIDRATDTMDDEPRRWRGDSNLRPGSHLLTVTLQATYLDSDSQHWLDGASMKSSTWPEVLKCWSRTARCEFNTSPSQSPIDLVTDASRRPNLQDAFSLTELSVWPEADNHCFVVLKGFFDSWEESTEEPNCIPISFDIALDIEGKEYRLDGALCHDGNFDHDIMWDYPIIHATGRVDCLPPEIERVDIVLDPNPAHAKGLLGVTEIWGKRVHFSGVPLIRVDLAKESGSDTD